MGDRRPGDNLYTASTVAVDAATGQIKGHFQYQPNESWDWDEVSPPNAFDAKNGKLLWQFPTNSGITSQPTSFSVDGKQYIAVQSGWGVDPVGVQNVLNRGRPGAFPEVPQGGVVWVFAVK